MFTVAGGMSSIVVDILERRRATKAAPESMIVGPSQRVPGPYAWLKPRQLSLCTGKCPL